VKSHTCVVDDHLRSVRRSQPANDWRSRQLFAEVIHPGRHVPAGRQCGAQLLGQEARDGRLVLAQTRPDPLDDRTHAQRDRQRNMARLERHTRRGADAFQQLAHGARLAVSDDVRPTRTGGTGPHRVERRHVRADGIVDYASSAVAAITLPARGVLMMRPTSRCRPAPHTRCGRTTTALRIRLARVFGHGLRRRRTHLCDR
jgi:hypothetical protein